MELYIAQDPADEKKGKAMSKVLFVNYKYLWYS